MFNSFSGAPSTLPPQMLKKSEKDDDWKKRNLDAMESIGRQQFFANGDLVENYQLVRGRFIYQHYFEREDYYDLVTALSQQFRIPSHLRHYDIISQVINTLSGEYQRRPDIFKIRGYDDITQGEFMLEKTRLLQGYVKEQLDNYVNTLLAQEGLDPDRQDFGSEEEQQQYAQQIDERKRALTPPEIERFMQMSWRSVAEIWAEHQLEADKEKYKLDEKEKKEFEDMLISDRAFRHFYLTPTGFDQETWNPINTFFHKSPEVDYIEDGHFVGRVFFLTIADIIDRYGHIMTEDQILALEMEDKMRHDTKKTAGGISGPFQEFFSAASVPFREFEQYKSITTAFGFDPQNPISVTDNMLSALMSDHGSFYQVSGLVQVTEGYWKSQRRVGKLTIRDPKTGLLISTIVDEDIDLSLMPDIVEVDSSMKDSDDENTIVWTWVNQIWKGVKISKNNTGLQDHLYIAVEPLDFQLKSELNMYGAKLPVCGQIFNNRNGDSRSLVSLMKPHQIGHNVAMNQLYEIMQREVGRFMLMDMNFLPVLKDWGGEKSFEKLITVAKQLGIAPLDGSSSNTKGSTFSHFQMIDLDESARMINRSKLAEFFELQALKQVGISPQRLGEVGGQETATGVQQAVSQSYAQTESYFTMFSGYKKRCLQMNLDIAQYVQSKNKDITMSYTKSDFSRAFMKLDGTDLLMRDLRIYVSNSQETTRVIETLRQLVLNNNLANANVLDLATIISSNSINEIKEVLKQSQREMQSQQQQAQQSEQEIKQQELEAAQRIHEEKLAFEAEQNALDRENKIQIETLKAMGYAQDNDINQNNIPDVLEQSKIALAQTKQSQDSLIKQKDQLLKDKDLQLKERDMILKERDSVRDEKLRKQELEQRKKEHEDGMKIDKMKITAQKNKPKPKK